MTTTQDSDLLFQTEADLARAEGRKLKSERQQNGDPIKLSSKPLDMQIRGNDAWIAESGFVCKKIDLLSGKTKAIFKDVHKGPVTSLVLFGTGSDQTLVTGSWDKSIAFWSTSTRKPLCIIPKAHTDFVKTLLHIPELNLLVSGGSDKDIRLWDLSSISQWDRSTEDPSKNEAPRFLASLRAHTRPLESLAYQSIPNTSAYALWTADSMGRICIWSIERVSGSEIKSSKLVEFRHHETAVYSLVLGDKQVWTASGDNKVLQCTFDPADLHQAPVPIVVVEHPYFVKSLLPLPLLLPDNEQNLLITGSTDESIRIWDLTETELRIKPNTSAWKTAKTTQEAEYPGLVRLMDEHFHEVNLLRVWLRLAENGLDVETWIVSASLDGTIRKWKLEEMLNPPKPVEDIKEEKEESLMTAEEEAELAELMDD